jgi:GNAT superfamily N-acetyltransferase
VSFPSRVHPALVNLEKPSKERVTISVREASLEDLPRMTDLAARAFMDGETFGDFMHPHRDEFPEHWAVSWERELPSKLTDDTTMNFVCIDDAASPGRIVGLSIVTRLGDGAAKISQLRAEMTERALVGGPTSSFPSASGTDRFADLQAIAAFEANWEDVTHYFSGPRGECWLIGLFCVDPDFQSKGFGQALLTEAVGLGRRESPPVATGLISTEVGERFYLKFGFEKVGKANAGAMSQVRSRSIMFYERYLKDQAMG